MLPPVKTLPGAPAPTAAGNGIEMGVELRELDGLHASGEACLCQGDGGRVRRSGHGVALPPVCSQAHPRQRPQARGTTDCLLNGGAVGNTQAIAAHKSLRTTRLDDRPGVQGGRPSPGAVRMVTLDAFGRTVIQGLVQLNGGPGPALYPGDRRPQVLIKWHGSCCDGAGSGLISEACRRSNGDRETRPVFTSRGIPRGTPASAQCEDAVTSLCRANRERMRTPIKDFES